MGAPPAAVDGTCVQNPDCNTNAWCADETYVTWCPEHDSSQCPTPQCMVKGTSQPEPEPEPEPETPGVTCKATPGLNRGVSDSACAQCANGYKWWPCNEAELCECTGTALAQLGTKMETKKRSEEKSNDEAKFPCAKRVMNCFAAYVQTCQPATTVGDSFLAFEASIGAESGASSSE